MVLAPVNPNPIPLEMKLSNQWIQWRCGKPSCDGKFAKYPIHVFDGYKVNAHDKANHLPFSIAYHLSTLSSDLGVGYVLNGTAIAKTIDEELLFLVGIDIDHKAKLDDVDLKNIWLQLGKPYVEASPSKLGIRIFCLSRHLFPNRNHNGIEVYTSGRFLTVTGWSGRGALIESTEQLRNLYENWFPKSSSQSPNKDSFNDRYAPPDTPRNRAWVNEMLSYINPDCDYETYRNVIWSIEATGWNDSEDIGRKWSLGAPDRFTEDGFTILRSSFDNRRNGITFGTLVHYAKKSGWNSIAAQKGNGQ